jgi:signal transduction histidine kinase
MSQWQIASLVVGLIHIALPLSAWNILYRKHDRLSVGLWCSGSLLFGLGFMFISLRDGQPSWLTFTIAGPLAFAGYPLRCAALRREIGRPGTDGRDLVFWVSLFLGYLAAQILIEGDRTRVIISAAIHVAGAALLGWWAWRGYRRSRFRSAALLAITSSIFALALVIRVAAQAIRGTDTEAMAASADFLIILAAAFVAALYGNLGYIGMALEASRRKELSSTAELAREHERLLQSELRLREQSALLKERAELLAQREEMLAALAHEVRQPLNNALAALTSATHAIERNHGDRTGAAARLHRANTVLMQVNSALDNTLTDAVLLSGSQPVSRQDVDLDMVVELALGDIDPQSQQRVVRERSSQTRTAAMNAGLMRLALRNVVANALTYSPVAKPVAVRIMDSDDPLAIVFEVCDEGPGISAELLPRLFTRGARGSEAQQHLGHGLGLHIVRRVMELHGGEAQMVPRPGGGLNVRLVVPQ